jgi:alpha-D-xyloside xylohydrolase
MTHTPAPVVTTWIAPGVLRYRLGTPEAVTPVALRQHAPAEDALCQLPIAAPPDLDITGWKTTRGFLVRLPLTADEELYGFGLQLHSHAQRGRKKTLRVNSDPVADTGDSHAPAPWYVSTAGYGVFIDTARYAAYYLGSATPLVDRRAAYAASDPVAIESIEAMFNRLGERKPGYVYIDIPSAAGVNLYLFAGPALGDAVRRYVLFSGGGCLPPRWGLGAWYRCKIDFDQSGVLEMAAELRDAAVPCDVLGLEPHWQTRSYSCSYAWSNLFPDPTRMIAELRAQGYRLNLWQHAFIHPTSPLYGAMLPYAGDCEVWNGLVPDFTLPAARETFAAYQEQALVEPGVAGFKLDECDNADFIPGIPWSFPEFSTFPSGLDGEQMHTLFGLGYQQTIDALFRRRDQRAYHQVRASGALAAPYPFVLYSDLYDHRTFIRGLVNTGFSGMLWCPEVRHAGSAEELIRRLQTVVCSPQALMNAWYIQHAPWRQWVTELNNAGVFAEDADRVIALVREVLALRMRLIPYLHAAFYRYATEGTPPFRALVMEYPDDLAVRHIDDQYLMGDRLLVAPVVAEETSRTVYLPAGVWYDFWGGGCIEGGQTLTLDVPLEHIPLFVRGEAVLPLATPTLHTDDPAAMTLTACIYGRGIDPCTLIEEDDATYAYERGAINSVTLAWDDARRRGTLTRTGFLSCRHYTVAHWEHRGDLVPAIGA